MKMLIKLFFLSIISIQSFAQFAQTHVFEEWAKTSGTQDMFHHSKTITDASGNVYVIGSSINSNGDYDIMVVKSDRDGVVEWEDFINGTADDDDLGTDIILDNNGDILVCGSVINSNTNGDAYLRKYNSTGTVLWTSQYNSNDSLFDGSASIAINDSNYVFLAGGTSATLTFADYLILKYDSAGTQKWAQTYDYDSLHDVGARISYSQGDVIVSGISQSSLTNWDIATMRFDEYTGVNLGTNRTGGSSEGLDEVTDVVTDDEHNIYVVGRIKNNNTEYDAKLIKLDSALTVLWSKEVNGVDSLNDAFNSVKLDADFNVYVTGYITTDTCSKDLYTIKYDSAGTQKWTYQYDGINHLEDYGEDLVLDNSGNLFITGSSYNLSNNDYLTLKLDTGGVLNWKMHYNAPANGYDKAYAITFDNDSNLIVTGQADSFQEDVKTYYTIKYIEHVIVSPPDDEEFNSLSTFVQNVGQLFGTNDTVVDEILFYNHNASPASYINDEMISLVLRVDSDSTYYHRIDLEFNTHNVNRDSHVYGYEKSDFYTNYFKGNIENEKRERVSHYDRLYRNEVWDDVDIMFGHNNKGIKLYFICKPGFNSSSPEIEFSGDDSVHVSTAGDLIIFNSIDSIVFLPGEAYQVDSLGVKVTLAWDVDYTVTNGDTKFQYGTYNSNLPLILELDMGENSNSSSADGNLIWSSYIGASSTSQTNLYDVNIDDAGFAYYAGFSSVGTFPIDDFGESVFPYAGDSDALLLKLDKNVVPQWFSYYGGADELVTDFLAIDIANCIDVEADGSRIFIAGKSHSSDLFTFNGGAGYEDPDNASTNNDPDAFIAGFDQNGALIWATYFGNSDTETILDVVIDSQSNIYAVGQRSSTTDTEELLGASNYSSGKGMLLKFDSSYNLDWATAWDSEFINGIDVDEFDNIYITGYTESSGMPTEAADPAYSQLTSIGSTGADLGDGFLTKFDNNGLISYSVFYGGVEREMTTDVKVDGNNNVFACGAVDPNGGWTQELPVITGGFTPNTSTSNNDHFIFKVRSHTTGNMIIDKAGYYGGGAAEILSPMGIGPSLAIDDLNYVYLTGATNSSEDNGVGPDIQMPTTQPSGFFADEDINNTSASSDAYIAGFDNDLDLAWATYFGGEGGDGGFSLDYSALDNRLYFTGSTGTNNNFANPELPIISFNDPVEDDFFQVVPNPASSSPAWAAFFNLDNIMIIGAEELSEDENSFMVYPNPNNGQFIIESVFGFNGFKIYDQIGKLIHVENLVSLNYIHNVNIDLLNGVYLIELTTPKTIYSSKIIVTN